MGELIAASGGLTALTVFTEDLPATAAFYRDGFGLPQVFEDEHSVVFRLGAVVVNVLQLQQAPSWWNPCRSAVPVDDVDAVRDELAARGVRLLNGPVDRPWGQRTLAVADPAGHVWEFAAAVR